jgi:hypothetical protein
MAVVDELVENNKVWGFIYDVRTGELEQVVGPDA